MEISVNGWLQILLWMRRFNEIKFIDWWASISFSSSSQSPYTMWTFYSFCCTSAPVALGHRKSSSASAGISLFSACCPTSLLHLLLIHHQHLLVSHPHSTAIAVPALHWDCSSLIRWRRRRRCRRCYCRSTGDTCRSISDGSNSIYSHTTVLCPATNCHTSTALDSLSISIYLYHSHSISLCSFILFSFCFLLRCDWGSLTFHRGMDVVASQSLWKARARTNRPPLLN